MTGMCHHPLLIDALLCCVLGRMLLKFWNSKPLLLPMAKLALHFAPEILDSLNSCFPVHYCFHCTYYRCCLMIQFRIYVVSWADQGRVANISVSLNTFIWDRVSCGLAQAGFELVTHLSQPPKCWDLGKDHYAWLKHFIKSSFTLFFFVCCTHAVGACIGGRGWHRASSSMTL